MSLLAKAPKNIKERLEWLRRVLTQEHVDDKISHYDRQFLTDYVEELHTEVMQEEDSLA